MKPKIDPKLRSLIETFKAQGFILKGIKNGFRIKLENGHDVDVYTLKSNPSHIRARIKTKISDEAARSEKIEKIYRMLSERTRDIAEVHRFKLTKNMADAFVYYAHVDLSQTPAYQETIVIGGRAEEVSESYEVTEVSVEADAEAEPMEVEASLAGEAPVGQADEQIDLTDFLESGEAGTPEPEDAVRKLEAVDAKTLRQALDNLSLPRSSNVRLVVTRLYRSAIDPEELEESIGIETEKINTDNDIAELKMIREMQAVDFLDPLIELLWQAVNRKADAE
ncbi:MAG TPA: hypothetical protein VKN73_01375 [Desulfosalsimonadaceae bacterium]|nr:hypothetical protein [Desulfosalsimonadaceae bacterium]